MEELIERRYFYVPNKPVPASSYVTDAQLADLLQNDAVRQFLFIRTPDGWTVQVLASWKKEFMTLVSLRREPRTYQDLDRFIRTVTKRGRMPLAVYLGEPPS